MVEHAKGLTYGYDEHKKEILLKEGSLQVMMEWEKPYMEACIAELCPRGNVLEVGFGLGYSATAIQKKHPASHTIIECDKTVVTKAKEWAKQYPNVTIVEDMWQKALKNLGVFETIFFDDYSPLSKKDAQQLEIASKKVGGAVEKMKTLRENVEMALKQFEGAKFTDEDLQVFGAEMLSRPGVALQEVINFVYSLVVSEHITAEQAERFIAAFKKKTAKKGALPVEAGELSVLSAEANVLSALSSEFMEDRLISFIEICLENHMKKGSRLSSFISSPQATKKKEFVERILSRSDIVYTEKLIPIEVPPNCMYYTEPQALVMVIEKK